MGYDLLAAIAFAVLTPLVIVGFVVWWALVHRSRRTIEGEWQEYAAARGIAFEAAEGEWPNRTSPALAWESGGASFRATLMGRESRAHTRIVVKPGQTVLGDCVVAVHDQATVDVRGSAARIFDDHLRRALLGFGEPVTFAYRKGRITIEWRGRERDPGRLDEARGVAAEAAAAVERAFAQQATLASSA